MVKKLEKNKSAPTINWTINENGFDFFLTEDEKYSVRYPLAVWRKFKAKNVLVENFIYARLAPLATAIENQVRLEISEPYLKKFIDFGLRGDLPQIAYTNQLSHKKLVQKFKSDQVIFNDKQKSGGIESYPQSNPDTVLLALSFGKDSLLTYGLLKELGLKYHLAYVNEMEISNKIENIHKRKIIKDFCRREKEALVYVEDNADDIYYNEKLKVKVRNFDNANGMLAFSLEFLPLTYHYRARYLLLGNEQNLNDTFKYQGHEAYPSFDQSSVYGAKLNQALRGFTANNYQVASLIEPLYNLAEFIILFNRYPHLLRYLMSCDLKMTLADKWCNDCPMCANAYLYSLAVGGDPKLIGFKRNLFQKQYRPLYPLFNHKKMRAYEMPEAVKDEQLLAFLLVYNRGYGGDLIELFKRKYLSLAKRREKELRHKFFKVYPAPNTPIKYRSKLNKIFQRELKQFI